MIFREEHHVNLICDMPDLWSDALVDDELADKLSLEQARIHVDGRINNLHNVASDMCILFNYFILKKKHNIFLNLVSKKNILLRNYKTKI